MSNEEKNKLANQIIQMFKNISIDNFIFVDPKNEIIIGQNVSFNEIIKGIDILLDEAKQQTIKDIQNKIKYN